MSILLSIFTASYRIESLAKSNFFKFVGVNSPKIIKMFGKYLVLLTLILFGGIVNSQGLIIDHNCTDITQIPADKIQDVKDNLKWHYAHTSHGDQIICGFESLELTNPDLNAEVGLSYLPEVSDAFCVFDGQEAFTYITPNDYWAHPTGIQYTKDVLNNNPAINISSFMWCDQLEYYTLGQVQNYLNQMSAFEAEFPEVTFVYFTSNTQVEGADGYNRYQNNELIRQYCRDNNKVLFDFADIECWYNGEWSYYIYNGDTVPTEHEAYYANWWTECGHTSELNRISKAKASWWLMAKLAGWGEDDSQQVDVKVYLEGPFANDAMDMSLNFEGHLPITHPYVNAPWNYIGYAPQLETGNSAICDWILLELRDAPSAELAISSTVIDWQVAFLMDDGKIVSINGLAPEFDLFLNDSLFVVVHHRNHLSIMSAHPLVAIDNVYSIDFTTSEEEIYGGASSCKEVTPGTWAMIAGDANADGIIDILDKSPEWTSKAGKTGYLNSDFNLNGMVDNQDKNNYWRINNSKNSQVPD
jgi:hypothetical protein